MLVNRQLYDEFMTVLCRQATFNLPIDNRSDKYDRLWPLSPSTMQSIQKCNLHIVATSRMLGGRDPRIAPTDSAPRDKVARNLKEMESIRDLRLCAALERLPQNGTAGMIPRPLGREAYLLSQPAALFSVAPQDFPELAVDYSVARLVQICTSTDVSSGTAVPPWLDDAEVVTNNPIWASYEARLPNSATTDVRGVFIAISNPSGRGVDFQITLDGLPSTGGPFRAQSQPQPEDMAGVSRQRAGPLIPKTDFIAKQPRSAHHLLNYSPPYSR
ncbi:hypothetical protein W97_05060 [Coniosporium apollinis CBS 100218]|uniref:Uncharacterized protein n=1 Tax=Coniosporium apollinis (strain CBS 100218) TaxID=1168221 RepID=R7YVX4_CONA1|nr:uncharacterized protein W97_05060 [Coniosporium apollinis CBS 100218]EON65821.1 hypothetical protein W97_05060 [Coniosporium apollinis CBS 100218]